MSKIKTYVCAYANATYRIGKTSITFADRCVSGYGSTYTSFNENEQREIEDFTDFRRGIIRLVSTQETKPAADETRHGTAQGNTADKTPYPEVTTAQEAITVLKKAAAEQDATFRTPRSDDGIREKAAEMNIFFPNWK